MQTEMAQVRQYNCSFLSAHMQFHLAVLFKLWMKKGRKNENLDTVFLAIKRIRMII